MSTVVITGANRGIGLELARQYAERGDQVVAACRSGSASLERLGTETVLNVDVTSEEGVANLVAHLDGARVDLLINNAGILLRETLEEMDFDAIRRQFEINSIGPLRVTHALLGNLQPGSKVAIITSRMGSIGDNTSGSRYGYRMSKAAVNMAGVSLAHDLRSRDIPVAILHPGAVRTEMTAGHGLIDAPESVVGLITRIDALSADNSGTFWHQNGEVLPW